MTRDKLDYSKASRYKTAQSAKIIKKKFGWLSKKRVKNDGLLYTYIIERINNQYNSPLFTNPKRKTEKTYNSH
jgi:hypothetical protein